MIKKYSISMLCVLLLSIQALFAQVSVNQLTGAANVVIPIYSLGRGGVSLPVNLVYNGGGVRVTDVEGTAGIGWNVQAGGQISRQVKGLPDDHRPAGSNHRTGWMYTTNAVSAISGFTIANTTNTNYADELADVTYINGNFKDTVDTEPDVFNISAPGLSCQLVYDKANSTFRTIPYMDIKIVNVYNTTLSSPLYGAITSFTITNDQGITYVFDSPELVEQHTVPDGVIGSGTYFQNTYNQYSTSVQFYDSWALRSMTDANGNGVRLTYTTQSSRTGVDSVSLYTTNNTGVRLAHVFEYQIEKTVTPQLVDSIATVSKDVKDQFLKFNYVNNSDSAANIGTHQNVISSITGVGRYFKFDYTNVGYDNVVSGYTYIRKYLHTYSDTGATTPVKYSFDYLGQYVSGGAVKTWVPDSTTVHQDFWGYYSSTASSLIPAIDVNPSSSLFQRYAIATGTPGSAYTYSLSSPSDRSANTNDVLFGSLQTVYYNSGGHTTIYNESNDYYDLGRGTNVSGNGIRVNELVNYDSVTGVTDTTKYMYTLAGLVGGNSSGTCITLPMFAFTTPTFSVPSSTDTWNLATIRSTTDLSSEDHTIMYQYIKVSHSGAGSTLYEYSMPATNWANSSAPACSGCSTEWTPTMNYISRNANVGSGAMKNQHNTYPFAPNPNYDFERGLLLYTASYVGNTSTKASETFYDYKRTGTPGQIVGFKYDLDQNNNSSRTATSYAKYLIYYGTSEQVSSVTKTIYDTQGLAQNQTSTVNYTYGATYHKPLTQQVVNSDGSTVTTNYSYVKDQAATTGTGNPNIEALYQLQQLNINAPVETYTTVLPVGSATTYVTGGSLTLFKGFPGLGVSTNYMPSQQLQFTQPTTGLAVGSFTPFHISGSATPWNSSYFATANFDYYDFTGILQTADDANKHVQGSYIDYFSNKPAITIKNAAASEVAFDDFDSDVTAEWTASYSPPLTTPVAGGHTGNYMPISNNQVITYTLQKNGQAINYLYSIWVKTSNTGSITLSLSGGGTSTATVSLPNTTGSWQYIQQPVSLSGISTTTMILTATVSCTGTIGIDDIIFYPQNAEVSMYAYDPTTHYKIAETNTNGVSAYYTNDKWGRLLLAQDQDKYITQRNSYVLPASGVPGYTKQEAVMVSGITTNAGVDGLSLSQKQTSLAYYDGLGRSLQSIAVQASPQLNDIVQPTAYDYTGRPQAAWLPYTASSGTAGSYRSAAIGMDQPNFYMQTGQSLIPVDGSPYNQQVFENSPLQRMLSAGMTGAGFQPAGAPLSGGGGTQHYKTITYRPNSASDAAVILWAPDGTYVAGNYGYGSLWVTTGTDEDGVQTLTYADIAGRTILKRQVNGGSNLDTYYIYNNAGMIAFIVPPKAVAILGANSNSLAATPVANLIFTFAYDTHGRLITKKVPGKGAMSIIYDPLNRPVLLQDANLAAGYNWNYIKYDVKGRAISQGIFNDASHRSATTMQTDVSALPYTTWYESRSTTAADGYYTNNVFPTIGRTPLAYGYFDNYDLLDNGTDNYNYAVTGLPGEVGATTAPIQGMPTMTLKSTVGSISTKFLLSIQFYDKNLHPIQTRSNNLLNYVSATNLTDTKTVVPDFTGTPTVSKTEKVTGTTTTVLTTPTYDNQKRITAVTQRYNNGAPVVVGQYSYNEIGQLTEKGLGVGSATANLTLSTAQSIGSTDAVTKTATTSITLTPDFVAASGSVFLAAIAPAYQQLVDYRFNIRGQLLSINNSKLANNGTNQNDPNALFGMELLYNGTDSNLGNTPYYNGKLSAIKWMARNGSNSKGDERAFKYTYDAVDRYTAANYARRDSTSTSAFSLTYGWNEGISSYDENGNIQALHRNMSTQGSSYTNTTIDRLLYTYDSNNANQLYSVSDTTSDVRGFGVQPGGNAGGHYSYDANGNLTVDPYKYITLIYNILNKTDEIDFTAVSGKSIKYIYDATGIVLQKIANDGTTTITTSYIDGFVYLNGSLSYFPTPEGRVTNNGGVLSNEYVISDQQGNARITFNNTAGGNTAKVIQENSYYGFGMVMPGSTVGTPNPQNKNLYNGGSEWQNQFANDQPGYYETFYRNYDAALGRFVGVDPQAEGAESMSAYQYSGNNPIMFNDPMGNLVPVRDNNPDQGGGSPYYYVGKGESDFNDWLNQSMSGGGGGAGSSNSGSANFGGIPDYMRPTFLGDDPSFDKNPFAGKTAAQIIEEGLTKLSTPGFIASQITGRGGDRTFSVVGSANVGGQVLVFSADGILINAYYNPFNPAGTLVSHQEGQNNAGTDIISLYDTQWLLGGQPNDVNASQRDASLSWNAINNGITAFGIGSGVKGSMIAAAINSGEEATRALTTYGKATDALGVAGGVIAMGTSFNNMYNQYQQHHSVSDIHIGDAGDFTVGAASVGATIFLATNPIGWGIGIGAAIYFTGRLIYQETHK